jgi:hypothetical protein
MGADPYTGPQRKQFRTDKAIQYKQSYILLDVLHIYDNTFLNTYLAKIAPRGDVKK